MKKPESKIEDMIENLAKSFDKGFAAQDEKIEDLARAVAKGFAEQDKNFSKQDSKIEALTKFTIKGFAEQDKKIESLTKFTISGFTESDKRFDKLEQDNLWVKEIPEKQTGTLARLDQERIFSLSYIQRLEADVNRIKKQLKIA